MRLPSWDAWGIARAKPHGVAPEQAQLWGTGLLKQSSLHRLRGSSRVCFPPPPDFTHPGGQERGASNDRQRRAQQHPDTSPAVLAPDSLPTFLDQLMLQLLP